MLQKKSPELLFHRNPASKPLKHCFFISNVTASGRSTTPSPPPQIPPHTDTQPTHSHHTVKDVFIYHSERCLNIPTLSYSILSYPIYPILSNQESRDDCGGNSHLWTTSGPPATGQLSYPFLPILSYPVILSFYHPIILSFYHLRW